MVHVSTPRPNLGAAIGQGLGQGVGQHLERQYEVGQLEKGLSGIKNLGQNASPSEVLSELVKASAYSPEIGKNLGSLYQAFQSDRNRQRTAEIPLTGGGLKSQGRNIVENTPPREQQQRQGGIGAQGKQFTNQEAEKFFPSNKGQNEAPGNFPQEATGGIAKPVLSGTEVLAKAQDLANQWAKAGITDRGIEQAFNLMNSENENNKQYNQGIENERKNRITEQQRYGELAQEALKTVLPNATDEQKAYFAKKGEEEAGKGRSEADTRRFLAREATNLKNMISNIEKSLSAPRIQNKLSKQLSGNEKTIDQAIEDASIQVRPLVENGLVDTARNVLAKPGFYPEERERAIFGPINPSIKKQIKDVDKPIFEKKVTSSAPKFGLQVTERDYTSESRENLRNNILSVWGPEENKDINMLQMRKEYGDLGYDWRVFKDEVNELFKNGQIKMTDDQFNQFNSYLNEPPLTNLEKVLHKLHIIGR